MALYGRGCAMPFTPRRGRRWWWPTTRRQRKDSGWCAVERRTATGSSGRLRRWKSFAAACERRSARGMPRTWRALRNESDCRPRSCIAPAALTLLTSWSACSWRTVAGSLHPALMMTAPRTEMLILQLPLGDGLGTGLADGLGLGLGRD